MSLISKAEQGRPANGPESRFPSAASNYRCCLPRWRRSRICRNRGHLLTQKTKKRARRLAVPMKSGNCCWHRCLLADELQELRASGTAGVASPPASQQSDDPAQFSKKSRCGWKPLHQGLRTGPVTPRLATADTARCALLRTSLRQFIILRGCPCADPGPDHLVPT